MFEVVEQQLNTAKIQNLNTIQLIIKKKKFTGISNPYVYVQVASNFGSSGIQCAAAHQGQHLHVVLFCFFLFTSVRCTFLQLQDTHITCLVLCCVMMT